MITGGFGMTMDLERGTMRQWVMGRDGVKRWADTDEPIEQGENLPELPTCTKSQTGDMRRCEACRETGAIHCSDPENCGGPWTVPNAEVRGASRLAGEASSAEGATSTVVLGGILESENMETLADALPKEQQRVRELLPMYDAIPTGIFAATMMQQSLARAEQAAASGDVVAMLAAYEDLKGYDA